MRRQMFDQNTFPVEKHENDKCTVKALIADLIRILCSSLCCISENPFCLCWEMKAREKYEIFQRVHFIQTEIT